MKKLFDLRFVIGIFFLTVGVLLIAYHFLGAENKELSNSVNIRSGILYSLFGIVMIIFSYTSKVSEGQ